jgi:hypothetical protein
MATEAKSEGLGIPEYWTVNVQAMQILAFAIALDGRIGYCLDQSWKFWNRDFSAVFRKMSRQRQLGEWNWEDRFFLAIKAIKGVESLWVALCHWGDRRRKGTAE